MARRPVVICFAVLCAVGLGGIGYFTTASLIRPGVTSTTSQSAPSAPFLIESGPKANLASLKAAAAGPTASAQASAKLGAAALAQSDFATAQSALEQSVARDPGQAAAWSALGETYLHRDRSSNAQMPPRARAAFDKALAIDPGDIRARFYEALEQDTQGKHDAAIAAWLTMLRQVPRGSHADGAIRAAIAASMKNYLNLVRRALDRVTHEQPQQ